MNKLYNFTHKKNGAATFYVALAWLWVMLLCTGNTHAQTVYADGQINNTTVSGLGVTVSVTSPNNAVTSPLTDSCRLHAASTVGSGTAYLQMIFGSGALPANTTVYIKYKSTGSLLGGGVAVQAYSGSASPSTVGSAVTTVSQDLVAPDGTRYIAVTSTSSFNAVRFTLSSPVALGTNTADVFYAFYVTAGTGCQLPIATTTTLTGVTLATIANPNNAIDGNVSTASDFNFSLSLAGSLTQTIYYQGVSSAGDATTLTLSVPAAVLSLGLFNATTVTAYNGSVQVGSPVALSSALSLDLVGLLSSGNPYSVTITPGGPFDRIAISMTSSVSLLNRLFLNEVVITPAKPAFTLPKNDTVYVCSGSQARLTADNPGAGKELRWYASALAATTTILHTGDTFNLANVTADTVFWVASGRTGCTASSERVPVRVLVRPLPAITFASPFYTCQHYTTAQLNYTNAVNSPSTYSITWGSSAATAGFVNVNNAGFPVSPLSIAVPGNASPQPWTGTLVITGANGCSRSYPFTLVVQATPHPPPPSTTFQ
jgi:hypothetical protein